MAAVTTKKVATSFIWQLLERFGAEIVTFVVSIILARLLDPVVYGTIALVTVITTILNVFVDSGFCSALIQKKNPDSLDYSTVFYFNILIALALYAGMFFAAQPIANFYELPELVWIIRVLSLTLVFSAIKNCSKAYVAKNMQFKKYFFSTLGGTIAAAVVGITMAYKGFGVWALVAQYVTNAFIDAVILFIAVKWKPRFEFSFKRLGSLFSFGWKLLLSSLTEAVCDNLRQFIIGKKYSKEDLAYYNRGHSFPQIIGTNITASLLAVLFPTFSSIQDDPDKVKDTIRKSISISSYLVFPMMVGLAVVAEPMISLLLTDKWLPCVPYLRMFCIFYALKCIDSTTGSVLKGTGKSGVLSVLQITKKVVDLGLLFAFMWFGVIYVAISMLTAAVIGYILNMIILKKYYHYSFREQIADILPNLLITFFMGVAVLALQNVFANKIAVLVLQVGVGIIIYFIWSTLTNNPNYRLLMDFIKSKREAKKQKAKAVGEAK